VAQPIVFCRLRWLDMAAPGVRDGQICESPIKAGDYTAKWNVMVTNR
jgi:hypothetical protein